MTSGPLTRRDSLFGETIVWTGGPKVTTVPPLFRAAASVSVVSSVVALAFAVVVARGLGLPAGGLLTFSAWCATLALASWRLPLWFYASARYIVTDRHVIWQRGRLRRSIDRDAISYAVIRWSAQQGVGDLVLERAVPTGALKRTLSLTLANVDAPDRLWAIVRGLTPSAPQGDGSRPLAQRLDDGERVLWSARPRASRWTKRRMASATLGLVVASMVTILVIRVFPPLARVLRLHALAPALWGLLAFGVGLGLLLVAAVAAWIAYATLIRPERRLRETRYFVTDRRVLIRRGSEELHLDRGRIAYVIASRPRGGDARRDLFLVLDGPQARAYSSSGAFGEGDEERLVPVLASIDDADTPSEILHVSRISIGDARAA